MRVLTILTGFLLIALAAGCGGPTGVSSSQSMSSGVGDGQFASSNPSGGKAAATIWDTKSLQAAPRSEVVNEVTEKRGDVEVTLKEVYYEAPSAKGAPMRVFAYYAYPAMKKNQRLPAIALVHGGGSVADRDSVLNWASRGFAVFAMDLPGKGGEAREKSRSEGPDMSDESIFSVSPSPKDSYLYAAVGAVCRAVSFLAEQKEVDRSRMGMMGSSWGGVITLVANGIDDRISAACTVFGSGFITEDSYWTQTALKKLSKSQKKAWKESFDPSSYLNSLHGRMLFVEATDDTYYPMRSFMKTYEGARCEKRLCLVPNANHTVDDAAWKSIRRWFDWALRSGEPLPTVSVKRAKGSLEVKAKQAERDLAVILATADTTDLSKAKWATTDVDHKEGVWRTATSSGPSFVMVRDKDGAVVAESVLLSAGK